MTADDLPAFPEIPLSPESRLRWLAWGRECMAIERERCAKMALGYDVLPWNHSPSSIHVADMVCTSIAAAIRSELPRNQEG